MVLAACEVYELRVVNLFLNFDVIEFTLAKDVIIILVCLILF